MPYPDDVAGAVNLTGKLQSPSAAHWFGTDEVGNDIFTRVIIGARLSLLVGIGITFAAAAIGVPLGILAGTAGGKVREVIMRLTDLFLSVPGPGAGHRPGRGARAGHRQRHDRAGAGVVAGLRAARRIQGAVDSRASRSSRPRGSPARPALRILWRHVLPNSISPIIVKMSMDIGQAILAVASLGFIGLGAKPPTPEWGAMISIARGYLPDWWWYAVYPGAFIYASVLGFNLLGDGLRDILDPRSHRG